VTTARRISLKCFFAAWIFAWVIAIYVPSLLIAATGLSPLAEGRGLSAAILAVADEAAPAAKIGFALLTGLFLFAARKAIRAQGPAAVAADMALTILAMLLMLALLPSDWSRGFGIGMTGTRFAGTATLIYLAGAGLAGLAFSLSEAKCLRRTVPTHSAD
jgi:hypothetical protein